MIDSQTKSIHTLELESGVVIREFSKPDSENTRPMLFHPGIGCDVSALNLLATQIDTQRTIIVDTSKASQLGRYATYSRDVTAMFELAAQGLLGRYPATMSTYAGIWEDTVEDMSVGGEYDLLGYSWGGILAQEIAIRNSKNVKNLILGATIPGVAPYPTSLAALLAMRSPDRSPEHLLEIATTIYGGDDVYENPRIILKTGANRSTDAEAYRRQYLAVMFAGWTALRLQSIEAKTLIIAGEKDPLVPVGNAHVMKTAIQGSELRVIPGAGHLVLELQAEQVSGYINKHIGSAGAPSSVKKPEIN